MKRINIILLLLFVSIVATAQRIDLSGQWRFAIDHNNIGVQQQWYNKVMPETVMLPGSMMTNGKGDDVDVNTKWTGDIVDSSYYTSPAYAKYRQKNNIKYPFWLQPNKYYIGAAWYQREITIPRDWKDKSIVLFMERCHWESRLWIDGKEIGMCKGLSVPQAYELTNVLAPGKHTISFCVDNSIKTVNVGINSHSISDHTQGNWNGIIGDFYLEARPIVNWKQVGVFPDIANHILTIKASVRNEGRKIAKASFSFKLKGNIVSEDRKLNVGVNDLIFKLTLPYEIKTWDEFSPNLYSVEMNVANKKDIDSKSITFGCRDWAVRDTTLYLNNHPVFMRGTLHCAAFPLTGYPSTDKNEWLREFKIMKEYGLNHVRFHTWCPPEVAFEAADELGMYLSIECSSWANDGRFVAKDTTLSANLGYGRPIDKFIYNESEDIVSAYGNHPSFCFMSYGNEPGGRKYVGYLKTFVKYWKSKDNRRLYTSAAGWPNIVEADYNNDPKPRIQGWGEGLKSIINSKAPSTSYDWYAYTSKYPNPFISHEIGQWCVYPDFKEMKLYTGIYKPKNFEIFKETLAEHGLLQLADSFLLASGKLQTLCYKADIEAALRTKKFGGFQLLGLNDFPGQGTALVGTLNVFWGEKGYVSPSEYRRFCSPIVPLARMDKLIYENTDTLRASVEVANYYKPLSEPLIKWTIRNSEELIVRQGTFTVKDIPVGNCLHLGNIIIPFNDITKAEQLNLEVSVNGNSNDWNIWVYPNKTVLPKYADRILLTDTLDANAQKLLAKGGSVILSIRKGKLKKEFGGDIAVGFSSIFWNTLWTNGQPPHTLGILCDPSHVALKEFPTKYYSDYQWWDTMSYSNAINIGVVNDKIKPIVRVIDDWFTNRSLALLFEARVGNGKVIVSGIDFNGDLSHRPAAKQLLFSIKKYMVSKYFNPSLKSNVECLNGMIE